jgi:NAD(P)H-nitrite reductase large subunit
MNVLIIGNGIAGTSCARMLRRLQPDHASCGITMISQEAPYHFSRPAMMYISTGQLTLEHTKPFADASWAEQGIALMHGRVTALDAVGRSCTLDDGRVLAADVMVLATGSVPSVPAHLDASLRGVVTYTQLADVQRLNDVMKGANHAVIIGGGLIAAECGEIFACMMEDRTSCTITCVVREDGFYGNVLPDHESMIVTEHLRRHGVRVVTNTEAVRLVDVDGRVTRVELSNGTHLPADCVVVATGVRPNVELASAAGIRCDEGILTDASFRTDHPGVLAIGDCAQPPWGVRQLWYTGRLHGEHAARIVLGQAGAFTPTTDFNSAKFFDLDWSTYGMVPRSSDAANSRLLIDRDGVRCIRIAHNVAGEVVGINGLGVRLDQRVCEKWIGGRIHVQAAIADISSVIFDAEFTPSFDAVTA